MTPTEPGKPSLKERIEALADGGLNGIVYPQLKEPLYRIAGELREIAEWMHDHRARLLPETTIIDKWADRLARRDK